MRARSQRRGQTIFSLIFIFFCCVPSFGPSMWPVIVISGLPYSEGYSVFKRARQKKTSRWQFCSYRKSVASSPLFCRHRCYSLDSQQSRCSLISRQSMPNIWQHGSLFPSSNLSFFFFSIVVIKDVSTWGTIQNCVFSWLQKTQNRLLLSTSCEAKRKTFMNACLAL